MSDADWLSQLLRIITVTGQLEVRCAYGAPWRVTWEQTGANEIPYHIIVSGRAILEDPEARTTRELVGGDIVLLPRGSAHVLHDGSGRAPVPTHEHRASAGWILSENAGEDEQLDLLCGRFRVAAPHERLIRNHLPPNLVIGAGNGLAGDSHEGGVRGPASRQLAGLVQLMRAEAAADRVGGRAILDALSSALFALVLRSASEDDEASAGLLALAGHPRLAPAIAAMFADPARSWTLPALAGMCGMSRATFMRHFHDRLGCSAIDLLTDLRMSLAANALRNPAVSTEAVAETIGYQSVSAFRRVFAARLGMTPGEWRRSVREGQ